MKFYTRAAALAAASLLFAGSLQAASITYEFGHSFGDVTDPDQNPPGGASPWLTATFDDGGGAGSVVLTMSFGADNVGETVNDVYFNLDDALTASNLTYSNISGPVANIETTGTLRADGSGLYDILFNFQPPPAGADLFQAGDTVVYSIAGAGLTALSFNFQSELEVGSTAGPYYAAAQVQSTGSEGLQSDWIAAVPVPGAVWLMGSALGVLGWFRRKRVVSAS